MVFQNWRYVLEREETKQRRGIISTVCFKSYSHPDLYSRRRMRIHSRFKTNSSTRRPDRRSSHLYARKSTESPMFRIIVKRIRPTKNMSSLRRKCMRRPVAAMERARLKAVAARRYTPSYSTTSISK